jgi:hypothetical protein
MLLRMKAEMDYRELVARSMVLHFAAGILLLMLTSPCRAASPVESVRLVLPENPGAITRRAAGILARQIAERCDAKVVTAGEAAFSIELGVEPGFGTEGYEIADGPSGSVRIVGNDERGLLYGIGKFLLTSRSEVPDARHLPGDPL